MGDPTHSQVRAGGVLLSVYEWNAALRGRDPSILLVHATGFHARAWDPVVAHLGARHVVSVDQRGHGRSQKLPIHHWHEVGEDLIALVRALGLADAVGVGHSMGGHALVEAAAALPGAFRRLVLIDPVIASPGDYGEGGWKISMPGGEPHPTAKRKNRFASAEAMIERFRDRLPYSRFEPAALRAYCEYGLLPAEDGDGFVLACPPEIEAGIYMTSRTNPGVYASVRKLAIPVLILRAKEPPSDRDVMDFSNSPTWPGLVREFPDAREVYLPDHTHFLPMEASKLVADFVLREGDA